jgi:hypothetical protein
MVARGFAATLKATTTANADSTRKHPQLGMRKRRMERSLN